MAFDDKLASRIRSLIGPQPGLTEQRMFGGLAFLIGGNMAVAASSKGGILLRVEPGTTMALAKKPYASPMEMRDKPMEGWLRVAETGVKTDKALASWVDIGVRYAASLPPKAARQKKKPTASKRPAKR